MNKPIERSGSARLDDFSLKHPLAFERSHGELWCFPRPHLASCSAEADNLEIKFVLHTVKVTNITGITPNELLAKLMADNQFTLREGQYGCVIEDPIKKSKAAKDEVEPAEGESNYDGGEAE